MEGRPPKPLKVVRPTRRVNQTSSQKVILNNSDGRPNEWFLYESETCTSSKTQRKGNVA